MKHIISLCAVFGSVWATSAASIEQVIVRQQWPWSTDVKVEYKLSGVDRAHPVNLDVKAYNGDLELDAVRLKAALTGDLYGISESGIGELFIDPIKAFGTEKVALANFKVKLVVSDSDANASEVLYRIYDLASETRPFPVTEVTRADLKNGKYGTYETDYAKVGTGFRTGLEDVLVWTGVTNNPSYKTTKLVMRKINAKNVTWKMGQTGGNFSGSENASEVHDVTLTKDYFIGIYPVTQEQYRRLAGSTWNGSVFKGEARPVENATFAAFQGVILGRNETNFGPGVVFDYPTEAEWEYACRAGTTSELYTGNWLGSAALDPIAWVASNAGGETHEVGLKLPNAFGLYDMIGNVYEACSDHWSAKPAGYADGAAVVDPTGPAESDAQNRLVMRGGYFGVGNISTTSAGRNGNTGGYSWYGIRLSCRID